MPSDAAPEMLRAIAERADADGAVLIESAEVQFVLKHIEWFQQRDNLVFVLTKRARAVLA
jgi:hypothetical protein